MLAAHLGHLGFGEFPKSGLGFRHSFLFCFGLWHWGRFCGRFAFLKKRTVAPRTHDVRDLKWCLWPLQQMGTICQWRAFLPCFGRVCPFLFVYSFMAFQQQQRERANTFPGPPAREGLH